MARGSARSPSTVRPAATGTRSSWSGRTAGPAPPPGPARRNPSPGTAGSCSRRGRPDDASSSSAGEALVAGCFQDGRVTEHYDVTIVGTGAGGGKLARTLAPSGKRILLLERGDFLTRESENWDPGPVFVDGRYISPDTWYDGDGTPFQPQVHYFVGGATKLYGAALYRLRPQDFEELRHHDGISPALPVTFHELQATYTRAQQAYEVHGACGEDPTEGPASAPYPFPAVSHEPRIQRLADDLA